MIITPLPLILCAKRYWKPICQYITGFTIPRRWQNTRRAYAASRERESIMSSEAYFTSPHRYWIISTSSSSLQHFIIETFTDDSPAASWRQPSSALSPEYKWWQAKIKHTIVAPLRYAYKNIVSPRYAGRDILWLSRRRMLQADIAWKPAMGQFIRRRMPDEPSMKFAIAYVRRDGRFADDKAISPAIMTHQSCSKAAKKKYRATPSTVALRKAVIY